jgi:hypothetical protein
MINNRIMIRVNKRRSDRMVTETYYLLEAFKPDFYLKEATTLVNGLHKIFSKVKQIHVKNNERMTL